MKRKLLILQCVIFIVFAAGHLGQVTETGSFRSAFRYAIVNIEPVSTAGVDVSPRQTVEVLLDPTSFERDKLITLFRLVHKRFPEPTPLYVNVYTSLSDVQTPEERDAEKDSDLFRRPSERDAALFVRTAEDKIIYIKFSDGGVDALLLDDSVLLF